MSTTYFNMRKSIHNKNTSPIVNESYRLSLTQYAGSNGEYVQLTLDREYICLNRQQLTDLIYQLQKGKNQDDLESQKEIVIIYD